MNLLNLLLAPTFLFVLLVSAASEPILIPNAYVAKIKSGMAQPLFEHTLDLVRQTLGAEGRLGHTYNFFDFRGFSFEGSEAVVDLIRVIPGVEYVHSDYMHHVGQQNNQVKTTDPTGYALDRISHRKSAFAANRSPPEFIYDQPDGYFTTIYVLDSGIRASHREFQGRVTKGGNFAPDNVLAGHAPRDAHDYANHGTPVAGLAAGVLYGAAKRASIVDVRILNDKNSGTYSAEVAGLNYAAGQIQNHNQVATSVINFSVGGIDNGHGNILKDSIKSVVNNGIFVSVSAGNERINVQYFEPANVPEVCTVGGSNAQDHEYYYSNFGAGIDIWAPGNNITAPSSETDFATKQVYGTSFAAPLVTGVSAIFKSFGTAYSNYSPGELCTYLAQVGTKNHLNFTYNEYAGPNVLLYDSSGH